jgi:SPP1 gp7 family putative phage head morphogenesis protein
LATSKYLIDVMTRHQVYLERLKTNQVALFDPVLRKIDRAIQQILLSGDWYDVNDLSKRKLEELIKRLVKTEQSLMSDYANDLTNQLSDITGYEAQFAEKALENALLNYKPTSIDPIATAWLEAKTTPVQATGQLLASFVKNWSTQSLLGVEATIRNAHAQGWTIDQTISAIRGTKARNYNDGILAKTQRNVATMVRTAVQHASNSARQAVWSENKDIVVGYRWISTLDLRTTTQCRSLDQQVFKLGRGPRPPLHPGCRSTTVPELTETADLLGGKATRSAKGSDGGEQVKASTTYYEWLLEQPPAFQDSAIGATRGKLLRDGGLSADEFARLNLGRNFEPLTLKEMRRLSPEVFRKANL